MCSRPLADTRVAAPPLAPETAWVAIRCAFTCNSCRFLAPLDALDADGAVECAHCGLRQRFDVEAWTLGLGFAHAVADLAGPLPEGRNPHPIVWIGSENPHLAVGTTRTFGHATFGALAIDAAPGHPVCGRCSEPLGLSVPEPGSVETLCPRCGDRARHTTSDAAVALYPPLVAAVSEEHRSDRPKARASATAAGVVTLSCPSCGAPLDLRETGTVHTCGYCRTSVIVPHQSVARALRRTPEPSIFWVLMQGPSEARRDLLAAPAPDVLSGEAAKKALKLFKVGRVGAVGDAPGVYEAPEKKGLNKLQVGVTLLLAALALAMGLGIALAVAGMG